MSGREGVSARERILDASYELFSQRGIRAIRVSEVIERAGVATATLYRHFPSKDELVLAFLQFREQRWTKDLVEAGAISRGSDPEQQLLAIFDVFDEWFHRDDFEACSFINVLLEMGSEHPAGVPASGHLEQIRSIVRRLAEEAGLGDTKSLARSFHILMKGSIIAASEPSVGRLPRLPSHLRIDPVRRRPQCSSGPALARPPLGRVHARNLCPPALRRHWRATNSIHLPGARSLRIDSFALSKPPGISTSRRAGSMRP